MKILEVLNLEEASESDFLLFKTRDTSRAVILDKNNNIALLKVNKDKFYKLPGGGIDEGEEIFVALERECMEEVGVKITSPVELGLVKEIKKCDEVIQNSYCYLVKMIGEIEDSKMTDSEIERGFEVVWVSIDQAINLVKESGYSNIKGMYVMRRELVILESALKEVNKI